MSRIGRIAASSAVSAVVAGMAMTGLFAAPAQAAETGVAASSDKNCDRKVSVGNARYKGDIFHSAASTAWVKHNHVGIYYTTKTIVEAPGGDHKSWSRTASTHRVCGPAYKMYVKAAQSSRNNAANYAYNSLRGKPYDLSFFNNKSNGDANLNCSELVWKAYKRAANIELDSNGGPGVYPDDIKNDGSTVVYQTVR
ncbi:hypothetical protein DMC64_02615 [Amycolatopsis sp. WAC 04197]|uniref:YiiX/YebB-like N1pC/P60 family cysteine hydrolase n=1 Tax=Amycolatopsis sp. WAC 04197 TaxID=2203199 RepID=UPI000F76AE86|nr:YiiX/YebB-like N1pC/P60 family cysteine hydrolase [Amycolatopsis sp. WAC 04197]RSN49474.1 hypothetical protein DMC64_02615 [Amycolatopsis sp. WAC 04197]